MNALALALRSLDPQTFEFLITSLLKARYPAIDIKHVNGQSGDQGLDVISGDLDEYPTIWQCKAFTNGIKQSQKQQVKDSLNRALKHYNPRRWVLCLNSDFDADLQRWWQRLAKSNINRTELQLWQASDIIEQLLYRDAIREQFFPAITLNLSAIRETLAGTKTLTTEDLLDLGEQNVDAYLARLEQMDARFSYALTKTRNQPPLSTPLPGTMLTVTMNQSVLHVLPRDREALKASPPQLHFSLKGEGVEKFFEHHRTGKPVSFTSDDVVAFKSDFDFLMPGEWKGLSFEVGPAGPQPTIPLRVTFENGTEYEYVQFRRTSVGTQESTFESTTPLPFPITLVLRKDRTGNVTFQDKCNGHDVHEARRMAQAITSAMAGGKIDFYDLSAGKGFFRAELNGGVADWLQRFEHFLTDASAVAHDYNVALTVPDVITNQEHQTLVFLRKLQAGFSVAAGPFTFNMEKTAQPPQIELAATGSFRIEVPEFPAEFVVFGKRILTGPVHYIIPKAHLLELDTYLEFLRSAPIGATFGLSCEPIGEITIQRTLPIL